MSRVDDGRRRARDDLRARRRRAAGEDDGDDLPRASARGAAERRRGGVLRHLAGAGRGRRHSSSQEALHERMRTAGDRDRRRGDRARSRRCCAADIKVDLSKETVGKPPATFEPMVGTWVVAQDGADKVIMVDGRPWVASKDNPTKLLIESARKLYGTSNEELMDNAKQFAYYPVAVLKSVDNFSNGTISVKFKTVAGDADRALGHPLQRQAERRLARGPLQRHREQRRAVGVPQRHPAPLMRFSDRATASSCSIATRGTS